MFTYDTLGRLDEQTRNVAGVTFTKEILAYDEFDRPTQIEMPNGEVVETTYDREGENALKINGTSIATDVRYNARGQLTFLDRYGHSQDTYQYYYGKTGSNGNSNFRLSEIRHGSTSNNLADYLFEYDVVGNITELQTTATAGDRYYTGHKANNLGGGADDLGLTYMNARFYIGNIGRFASADTIIPDPTNPQQYNRYTYVLNNALKLIDPSGHCAENIGDEACWALAEQYSREYGIDLKYFGLLTYQQLTNLDLARVLAYTVSQLVQTKESDLTELDAMFNILNYAIEEVAGGDSVKGLEYAASIFYRSVLDGKGFGITSGFDYQNLPIERLTGGVKYTFGTMSGFDSKYQDSHGNQVEHFINEALVATKLFSWGFSPDSANDFMYIWEAKHGVPLSPDGQADYELGKVAVAYAYGMRYGEPGIGTTFRGATKEERDLTTTGVKSTLGGN